MKKLREALVSLNLMAEKRQEDRLVRKAFVMAAKFLKNTTDLKGRWNEFKNIAEFHERETSSWISHDELESGGAFDACDLRHWLVLSEKAGVPFVPAREILALSEDELSYLSGKLSVKETPVTRSVEKNRGAFQEILEQEGGAPSGEVFAPIDREELVERLYAAMDDVPEGEMVRNVRCGSSELKAFAGAGAAGSEAPSVRFGSDVEVGPGWVRTGNRRRVHVSDARTIESVAQGPSGATAFVARPWEVAARYAQGDDPHRHGTVFAGKGIWPFEWRAFVEGGNVVGVSCYYAWCGEVTQENAKVALEVRDLAQKVVDQATKLKAWPRFMDVEFVRRSNAPSIKENQKIQRVLQCFGREVVSCTLDFIETDGGLKLLEGGPPNTPFGGGHPCGFAGSGGAPKFGNKTITQGVAFKLMPGVLLGDPATWKEADRSGCILSWDEVSELANASDYAMKM